MKQDVDALPTKKEIAEIKRNQGERIDVTDKITFTGKDDVVWKPWCINHISMALGDALPTNRDPLKVCRVIAITPRKKGRIGAQKQIIKPIECFVCEKTNRFWMAEH